MVRRYISMTENINDERDSTFNLNRRSVYPYKHTSIEINAERQVRFDVSSVSCRGDRDRMQDESEALSTRSVRVHT